MKLIIDAMSGDHAPLEIVKGALEADFDGQILLVGREVSIIGACEQLDIQQFPANIEIFNAEQVVEMEDDAGAVMREKPDSSMAVALRLLAEGQGDAVISAGNTGALLAMSTLTVKRIRGIRRAALAPILPSSNGGVLLLDCGANVECTAEYLYQFALMGYAYAKKTLLLDNPRVGLLNIGSEEGKGTAVHREAYQLLKQAHEANKINFIGNAEARDMPFGVCDVLISDGFSGNILLKTMEGVGLFFAKSLKDIIYKNGKTKIAGALLKKDMAAFKKMMDYTETGGAPLLGIAKPVIKAHGSSNAKAICGAIRQAKNYAAGNACGYIQEQLS
ncbi:MAG: phosphate acyltransferase PlsX [Oscillospiraceae bacterium]|nr:phosphate acyltransferase PlsX [Oscillospiraceae bacterium]